MTEMADVKLKMEMELVPAEMRDFTHYRGSLSPAAKNVGMVFVVLNSAGLPELYRIGPDTDLNRIAFLMEQDRVFVFSTVKHP